MRDITAGLDTHLKRNFQDANGNFLWERRIMQPITHYYHHSGAAWPRAVWMSDLVCCFESMPFLKVKPQDDIGVLSSSHPSTCASLNLSLTVFIQTCHNIKERNTYLPLADRNHSFLFPRMPALDGNEIQSNILYELICGYLWRIKGGNSPNVQSASIPEQDILISTCRRCGWYENSLR